MNSNNNFKELPEEIAEQLQEEHFNVRHIESLGGVFEISDKIIRARFSQHIDIADFAIAAASMVIRCGIELIQPEIERDVETLEYTISHWLEDINLKIQSNT